MTDSDHKRPIIEEEKIKELRHYVERNKNIEAVFIENDYFAAVFYRVCHGLGIRIPEDIAIVGFDDDVGVSNLTPPLITVWQDGLEIGRRAAEVLLGMIEREKWSIEHIRVPVELKVRKSCGC